MHSIILFLWLQSSTSIPLILHKGSNLTVMTYRPNPNWVLLTFLSSVPPPATCCPDHSSHKPQAMQPLAQTLAWNACAHFSAQFSCLSSNGALISMAILYISLIYCLYYLSVSIRLKLLQGRYICLFYKLLYLQSTVSRSVSERVLMVNKYLFEKKTTTKLHHYWP